MMTMLFCNFVKYTILPMTQVQINKKNDKKYYLELNITGAGSYYFKKRETTSLTTNVLKKVKEDIETFEKKSLSSNQSSTKDIKEMNSLVNKLTNIKLTGTLGTGHLGKLIVRIKEALENKLEKTPSNPTFSTKKNAKKVNLNQSQYDLSSVLSNEEKAVLEKAHPL